jgi:hypothetical protein
MGEKASITYKSLLEVRRVLHETATVLGYICCSLRGVLQMGEKASRR